MQDYVWVVAGGLMQIPAITAAQNRGFKVIVTDGNENCPAKEIADEFHVCDTYSVADHLVLAKWFLNDKRKIRAVLCPGADVGPTVAAIAEFLGLTSVPYKVAVDVRNKVSMRLLTNYKRPRYMSFYGATPIVYENWLQTGNMPCVIKPSDNCATRGMTLAYTKDDFMSGIKLALSTNKDTVGGLVEEYMTGSEYALDWIMRQGEISYVNGVYRLFRHHTTGSKDQLFGIEGAIVNPFVPPQELINLAQKTARRLGVFNGLFKTDVLLENNEWRLLECATRWSGGWDSMYLAPLVDRNITEVLLDYSLGLDVTIPEIKENKFAASYVPFYRPMTIKRWEWVKTSQELHRDYNVQHVFITENEAIKPLKDCAKRPAYFIATGQTWLSALRNAYRASRYVVPIAELE